MTHFPPAEAEQLGRRLHWEGFRPLPDVTDDGQLIGTILWRQHGAVVEYLALRTHGFALAMRAEALFSFRTPHLHGAVIQHRYGPARDALAWLLTAGTNWPPRPHGHHRRPDDERENRR